MSDNESDETTGTGTVVNPVGDIAMPKFTLLYNIVNSTTWIGTGWEFFSSWKEAKQTLEQRRNEGHCCTLRPFNAECDTSHLGACHRP